MRAHALSQSIYKLCALIIIGLLRKNGVQELLGRQAVHRLSLSDCDSYVSFILHFTCSDHLLAIACMPRAPCLYPTGRDSWQTRRGFNLRMCLIYVQIPSATCLHCLHQSFHSFQNNHFIVEPGGKLITSGQLPDLKHQNCPLAEMEALH